MDVDAGGGPAWGAVSCQPNGACTFRATAEYAGPDRFRYTVTNPLYGPTTVEVAIEVTPLNDPPLARDDRAVTTPDQAVVVAVTTNDEDPNDPAGPGDANRPGDRPRIATIGAVAPAGAGTVACADASCTFSPAPGFTYAIVDGGGLADDAVVEVFVDPAPSPVPGFSGEETTELAAATGSWGETTSAGAVPSCGSGRPRVTVRWQAVDRATGYRIERRTPDTDRWVEVAVVERATLTWADDLVGEAQSIEYRVSSLLYRWTGQPSAATSVTTPPPSGPGGC